MNTLRLGNLFKLFHASQSSLRTLAIAAVFLGLAVENLAAAGRTLFFPHLISGMGFETRLVLNNPSGSPANVKLTARNDDGTLLSGAGIQNPATVTIAPYQQVSVQADKILGLSPDVLTLGWIQGDSDNSQVTGLLFVATSAQQDGVGIAAADALQTNLAGAIPSGLQTAMALINPNPTPANVTLQLFDATGNQRSVTTFSIPAQGHRAQFLNDGSAAATALIEGGHFEIGSDVGLGGLEVMTGVSGYTLNPVTTPTSGPFIFPQVSSGPNDSTSLVLQNTGGVAVQVRWSAWNSQGQAFQSSDTSPVSVAIPAHGTFTGTMADIFGPANAANFSGSVQASLVPVSGNVQPALAAGLSLYTQGTAVSSLPAQVPTSGIFLLGQDPGAAPGTTSFELLNPGTSNAQISILYYGANGNALGNLSATLPPHQPYIMNPGAASQAPAGTTLILMRATAGVVGYQLQTDSTGQQQLLGGRAVPAQIGGAAPLSAALGGKVESSDTLASVDVPLGALPANTAITISSLSSATAPLPPTGMVVVAAFQLSPLGMTFNQPVTLTFPVLNAVPLPSPAFLQVYNPLTGAYVATTTVVSSGIGGTTLTATLSSFPQGTSGTVLVVLAPQPGGGTTPIPVPIVGGGGGVVSGGGGGGGGTTVPSGGSGGVVTSGDGQVAVVIPPGALPSATTVAISTVSPSTLPKPTNSQGVLLAADAEPSGISFSSPVTLRFTVPAQLQGRLPSQLPLEVYNPLNGQYQATGFQAVLSADGTTLTASVTHFTTFVILQPFTPFASPIVPTGTLVNPLGIVSVAIPAAIIPPVIITSFAPTSGQYGTTVTISGSGFTGASAVFFNLEPAAFYSVLSDNTITAVVPGDALSGPISVSAPGGTTDTTQLEIPNFTVTSVSAFAPTISSFSPAFGPIGTTVVISGANFIGATVLFGSIPAAITTISSSQIYATVPAGLSTDSSVAISVTNPLGTATLGPFTVASPTGVAPTITSFAPGSGTFGAVVTITGVNFTGSGTGPTGVTFNGLPAASFTFNSDTSVTATVPTPLTGQPGVTSGPIAVTTAGGTGVSTSNFLVQGKIGGGPEIFNIYGTANGTMLPTAGLTVLNPSATNGVPGTGTLLPTAGLTVLNQFSTSGTPGTGTVFPTAGLTVLNQFSTNGAPGKGTLLPTAGLTVLNQFNTNGVPGVGTLFPTAGLTVANESSSPLSGVGGTDVIIKGAGFWDGSSTLPTPGSTDIVASVTIAGQAASSFAVTDDNTIVAEINPNATPASGPIVVTFTNGLQFIPSANFTITASGTPGSPTVLALFSGTPQTVTHGAISPVPLIARVTDSNGLAVSGVPVTFAVTGGTGILGTSTGAAAWAASLTINTDPPGLAGVYLTPSLGANTVQASGAALVSPGTISTAAGSASGGFAGDGNLATLASLNGPYGAAYYVDVLGVPNLYIADYGNGRVRKVSGSTGDISTVAGGGTGCVAQTDTLGDGCPATNGILSGPADVALDSSGNLYITERGGNRVRMVSAATGNITTVAGAVNAITGTSGFSGDGGLATSALLNQPIGLAVDAANNIYIADFDNNRIQLVTAATGKISTVAGNVNGSAGNSGDGGLATNALLSGAIGVAVDNASPPNIYIADYSNERVRKVTGSTGIITAFAGGGSPPSGNGDGGPATSATLSSSAWGVAVDASGNVYVAGQGANRVRKVDVFGTITTLAGNGTAGFIDGVPPTTGEINEPLGLAVDTASPANLYVADYANNRIRKVTPVVTSPFGSTVTYTVTGQ